MSAREHAKTLVRESSPGEFQSDAFAAEHHLEETLLGDVLLELARSGEVKLVTTSRAVWDLTPEGAEDEACSASPEARVWSALDAPQPLLLLEHTLGRRVARIGVAQAAKRGWVQASRKGANPAIYCRSVGKIVDECKTALSAVRARRGAGLADSTLKALRLRKLVVRSQVPTHKVLLPPAAMRPSGK
jgi:hypothetical protein